MAEASEAGLYEDDQRRLDRDYEIVEPSRILGEGTYGKVYKARNRHSNRIVALKKMPVDWDEEGLPSTFFREIALLKALAGHRHVVELLDIFAFSKKIVLIFEFLDSDLKKFMRIRGNCLSADLVKKLAWQLLLGVEFCHAHCVLHRDIKPQNLLIDHSGPDNEVLLKLADFGLSRHSYPLARKYTQEVVTVWYRAPELLLGSGLYSAPLDIWSCGCVIAEMAVGRPLFNGDSEIDTIFRIFKLLGTPSEERWPGCGKLPNFKMMFPKWPVGNWAARYPQATKQLNTQGVEMVASLLVYDPRGRLSAKHAVHHPFFEPTAPSLPPSRQVTPQKEKEWPPPSDGGDTQTPEKIEDTAAPTGPGPTLAVALGRPGEQGTEQAGSMAGSAEPAMTKMVTEASPGAQAAAKAEQDRVAAEAEHESKRQRLAAERCAHLAQLAADAGAEAEKKRMAAEAEKQLEDARKKRTLDEAAASAQAKRAREMQSAAAQKVKEEQLAAEAQHKALAAAERQAKIDAQREEELLAVLAAARAQQAQSEARTAAEAECQRLAAQEVQGQRLAARLAAEAAKAQQDRLAAEADAKAEKQRIALAEAEQERLEARNSHKRTVDMKAAAAGGQKRGSSLCSSGEVSSTSRERPVARSKPGVVQLMPAQLSIDEAEPPGQGTSFSGTRAAQESRTEDQDQVLKQICGHQVLVSRANPLSLLAEVVPAGPARKRLRTKSTPSGLHGT